jgi:AhpD family alkylhydroperoxidase
MSNRRKQLDEYLNGLDALGKETPDAFHAFKAAYDTVFSAGALDIKTKHLIAIALCVSSGCKPSVVRHVSEALKAGAERREIVEAATIAVVFGGSPALTCAVTALKEAMDEFGAM